MQSQTQQNFNQEYTSLQKNLDNEHRRLMQERSRILSKQHQRLELYEKLDLVQFFNYHPNQSKKQMMYHLTQHFKEYMRKLTENNVYYRRKDQQIGKVEQFRSNSKSKGKTNVERNSELGRMFQVMRFYEDKNNQNSTDTRTNSRSRSKNGSNSHDYQYQSDIHQNNLMRKLFENQTCFVDNGASLNQQRNKLSPNNDFSILPTNQHQKSKIIQSEQHENIKHTSKQPASSDKSLAQTQLSIYQLSHVLYQQEKIYLLSELNHYIKLFKESEIKRQFMQKHLQNLHEFVVDVRFKQQSKNKSYRKYQSSFIIHQNELLKKEIQIYKKELKTLTKIQHQDFHQLASDPIKKAIQSSRARSAQIKKIDRFQEFAQHIKIMQTELSRLIVKINENKISTQQQLVHQSVIQENQNNKQYIYELERKVQQLEDIIRREESKKAEFFNEVKKFKELMRSKDQELINLRAQLQNSSRKNYYDNKDEDLSLFINRTLSTKQNQFPSSKRQYRYSTVTTKQPSSQFQLRNSRTSTFGRQNNFIRLNSVLRNNRNDMNEDRSFFELNQSRNSASRSKSKSYAKSNSRSRSRPQTNYIQSYEPRPYERYNRLQDYENYSRDKINNQQELNPLYHRIS